MNKPFLVVTALAEVAAGLALLMVPRLVFEFLLGTALPSAEALLVGRVAGAALLSLGIICWLARTDPGSPSLRAVLSAMLAYNIGVAAVLGYASSLGMSGALLWPAVLTHSALALWGVFCLRSSPASK